MQTNMTVEETEKECNCLHNWKQKAALHRGAHSNCGQKKLLICVMFERKTMPKAKLPNSVDVRVQGKGWMDAAMVCDWVHKVWGQ
jgi:hypothetical protein